MKNKPIKSLVVLLVVSVCVIVYAAKEVRWDEADKYYGQTVTVTGKIAATHNSGKACFLNFHQNWKRYFTAVIFASDFHKFPPNPENYYLNKEVKVTGFIKEYKGKPEIILKDPSQIVIVDSAKKAELVLKKPVEVTGIQSRIITLEAEVRALRARVATLETKIARLENLFELQPLTSK
ncbi:hypothetical protein ES703_121091 [subsurface metagenome]